MTNMPPPPPPASGPGGWPPAGGSSPAGSYGGGSKPDNYLVWAILTTLFCCMPLGVVSIVFAAQVDSKWSAGDHYGARDAAAKAQKFAKWSALAAVIVGVLYFGFVFLAVGLSSGT